MAHTFTNILVHVIFSTKDRLPQIDSELRPRLFSYMGGLLREMNVVALRINGPDDHVHLLLALSPVVSMAEVMRVLKTNSSKWVHEDWPARADFAWQTGYGAFSVSQSNVDRVCLYIDIQEEHHRTVSFQEEFIAFLTKHRVPYDARYIWE